MTEGTLRVAIFNDSLTMLAALRAALTADHDIEIVAERTSADDAPTVVAETEPDVVVMDVVMPGLDGFQATRAIMRERPTPIVMVSSVVNPKEREVVFAALEAGALHIAEPPPAPSQANYPVKAVAFRELVRTISGARVKTEVADPGLTASIKAAPDEIAGVGLVSSAGGPQALLALLPELREDAPPVLLVQHLAPGFTESFARWLTETCAVRVDVAAPEVVAQRRTVYVAPEGTHLWLQADGRLAVRAEAPVKGFRPSGDLLLARMGEALGPRAVGMILSGMGRDGAQGAETLSRCGGTVLAQADASISSMPDAASQAGVVDVRLTSRELGRWLRGWGGAQ